MSGGGNLGYACYKVEMMGQRVYFEALTPLHKAFAAHLDLVAKALHDLEWMLSGDYNEGDEVEAIKACVGDHAELEQLVIEGLTAVDALNDALARADALKMRSQDRDVVSNPTAKAGGL